MTTSRLAAFRLHSSLAQLFTVSNLDITPGVHELTEGGFEEQECRQGFAWFQEAVIFFPYGESGVYWVEVFLSNSFELEEGLDFAISLPFVVSEAGAIQIGGSDDIEETQTVNISRSTYRLVHQERQLTQPEIDRIPVKSSAADPEPDSWLNLGPKSCKLTFIPTSIEVDAEILKAPEGTTIKLPLLLRK